MARARVIVRTAAPPSRRRARAAAAEAAAAALKAEAMATSDGQQQLVAGPGQAYRIWIERDLVPP